MKSILVMSGNDLEQSSLRKVLSAGSAFMRRGAVLNFLTMSFFSIVFFFFKFVTIYENCVLESLEMSYFIKLLVLVSRC